MQVQRPFPPNAAEPLGSFLPQNSAFDALNSATLMPLLSPPLLAEFWEFLDSNEPYASTTLQDAASCTVLPSSSGNPLQYPQTLHQTQGNYSAECPQGWVMRTTVEEVVAPSTIDTTDHMSSTSDIASVDQTADVVAFSTGSGIHPTLGYNMRAMVSNAEGHRTYSTQSTSTGIIGAIQNSLYNTQSNKQIYEERLHQQFNNVHHESYMPNHLHSAYNQTSYDFIANTHLIHTQTNSTLLPMESKSLETDLHPVQSTSTQTSFQIELKVPQTTKKRKRAPFEKCKEIAVEDSEGVLVGTFATFGNKWGRQAYSKEDRRKTALTRQIGACIPCKLSKKRCDRPDSPYECCRNCKSRVLSMPCFAAKIIEAQLFRDKPSPGHPESLRREVYDSLVDLAKRQAQPIRVVLTQDFGVQLEVSLALYEPEPGEITYRVWKDSNGVKHKLDMPPYCIADMQEAQDRLLEYIRKFRGAFIRSTLMRSNEVTTRIFDQAQLFAAFNPASLVSQALSLCAASRIIERDWRICIAPSSLSIPFISDDPANPFYNTFPITPMMDAQLDQIVIRNFLSPIRERLLSELQTAMTPSDSRELHDSWFEIFLTLAVLLSHAEWLLDHSRRNAIRMGAKKRYNYIPRAEAYFYACRIMLAHWHHLCKNAAPLMVGLKTLQGEEKSFVESLWNLVKAKETLMRELRENHKYEVELYWCHQLFFPGWNPGRLAIEDAV
ncbi:hypothetical protein GQ43DRAFT_289238 [Delitschia confertaspora ATCC 74209]|uniref:Zn(2)-C6 fungal-type domain-containing protein n=1 Tax=Delitschia confertaspora ATCC 74209 TaxID=1513339 RepID=A0A9P4N0M0_9PLEO|nr:hypothetical protein GQ43DRAFT_289238 [Delitschia confertaspora ATCC 74209]